MNKPLLFIKSKDELAASINSAANELYHQIKTLDVDALEMDPFCKGYFKECHSGRLIFSLQCSARIIHDSVNLSGKKINDITFVDYGAGLGTLFMLAAKLPFKEVIYNDHLQEWCSSAEVLCKAMNIPIRHFIKGDIEEMIAECKRIGVMPDIIASRNVIEHIYDLGKFFRLIKEFNPTCLVFSSTTANYQNPAMHLKHIFYHKKVEKKWHIPQREKLIVEKYPSIEKDKLQELVKISRGKANEDFDQVLEDYMKNKKIVTDKKLGSNTCNATNGVWAEHLLSRDTYRQIIESAGFEFSFEPGFWDTHYKKGIMNVLGSVMNSLINAAGKGGTIISPFVHIIAKGR